MLKLSKKMTRLGAYTSTSVAVGMMSGAEQAFAGAKTITDITNNIITGIGNIPGFITALAYIFGVLLAVLGILKIKDHVENPSQTPLKEGAIRLAVGGMLFALPLLMEALQSLADGTGGATGVAAKNLKSVTKFKDVVS